MLNGLYFISRNPVSSNEMTKSTLVLYNTYAPFDHCTSSEFSEFTGTVYIT